VYLKNLTLKGFKSFASSTTLHFEPGVTCVVGPNGSGKSNVVDALAWVMGEQGAKSLRGGKMEDVIFSGTAGKAPLGRAEVALTIDNSDGALPIEFSEVTISRTLFRHGGSEYAINGEPCRLLDVQELLSDSGIGREMHVIVGQGQLDTILQATPEDRRGFIEEAAGVLKHRKRKEKALRKLDAMAANMTRLQDLSTELRRQLKPLGRQAEVARRAVVIQSDVRDARLRLLADDLVTMRQALDAEVADETALRHRQQELEEQVQRLQQTEAENEAAAAVETPAQERMQQAWFGLSGLRERFHGLVQLAAERVRNLQPEPEEERSGRDPELIESEARQLRSEEFDRSRDVDAARAALLQAETDRLAAEQAAADEVARVTAAERTAADRREGLARLTGQVNAAGSRMETRTAEIERLTAAIEDARERGEAAQSQFVAIETEVAGLDAGEVDLDSEYERARRALVASDEKVEALRMSEAAAERERAALTARRDALRLGLERSDAASTVVAASDRIPGVLGSLASLLQMDSGVEHAVAAALGDVADAVVVRGIDAAVQALILLKDAEAGRAALIVADDRIPISDQQVGDPPAGRWLRNVITCSPELQPVVDRLLSRSVLVDDVNEARQAHRIRPDLMYVTRSGDVIEAGVVHGGSVGNPSLLEAQAAFDETEHAIETVTHELERQRFALSAARQEQQRAAEAVEGSLAKLHESDARMAAVAEQLGQLGQLARSAFAEAERLTEALAAARSALAADEETLRELQQRLQRAEHDPTDDQIQDRRDEFNARAIHARQVEVDARLALRTGEERVAAIAARAEQLEQAAASERTARANAIRRREQRARELITANAVLAGAKIALGRLEISVDRATLERERMDRRKGEREQTLSSVRTQMREFTLELDRLKDTVHRDEVARAEQRMRIEQVHERAMTEFGIEPDVLIGEYGPEQLVPPSPAAPGDEVPADAPAPQPYPFVREFQEKRLKAAERDLALLGKVNPLALEEFTAMEERFQFLSEQLEDLRKSRDDLLDIVKQVDARVEQVFTEAYEAVQREFTDVFARLFPGGEGRLILTDPSDMLNTGVDVEARPPGKKVKRLSLLSGGERSLTAVAFLVALFKARPSPFYVLDEVEAALDDTNLGRLIDIIEELRSSSQLIVITHQKRTMEIADALYGVSMRGDGVTQVISQRLREAASA
jgi:chromosome segregation protein